jgi:[protein-PII] uridylyltransferase
MASSDPEVFDAEGFDAALRELSGRPPLEALPRFRQALREGRNMLEQAWHAGLPVDRHLTLQAKLIDALLARAWTLHANLLNENITPALIAVGGYGRGELYPHSDIDLLLLLKGNQHNQVKPFAEPFLQFLWDMGLEVGHSVRSLNDCVTESKKDITVATNLMEARLLTGPAELFAAMQARTGPARLWPSRRFFAAKLAEQHARHARYDDTAYNLEPNIKESPGGLRDIQMIAWVTQRHFGTNRLRDLVPLDFLTDKEFRSLERGRRLLATIRCGLHYLAGRREDRLLFDHQRALAEQMDFHDKRGHLGVELFMKRFYLAVKELSLLNEILLQHFEETLLTRGHPRTQPINRRFQAHGNFLEVTRPNIFERFPSALLELFLILQQHPKLSGVRAATIRLVRENLHRINTRFRRDLACRSLFMEILRQPHGITHVLRRMNAYGVLGAYLPVFGRVVGQMQHDLFHVYTVDEHTLFVVRNLRRFTVPEYRHEFPFASELSEQIVKPERLYLAGLFHDIAKGRGGDHSELGEIEVIAFCRTHGLSDYDTRFVAWLVRQHLLMSNVAQRQDIHDPAVILDFARKVGDPERLAHLYLLTVADMRGTSPSVWNVWKDRLLRQLYNATLPVLQRGLATPLDLEDRLSDLKRDVLQLLEKRKVPPVAVASHLERMDADYFLRHEASTIAWHTEMILQTPASELPLVATRYQPEAGGTECFVYTPDRDDLFVVITGGFDRLGLTIMDARIHTTRSGFALDTFVVLDHAMQPLTDLRALAELATGLREQLLSPKPGRDFAKAILPRTLKHFPIHTEVRFGHTSNNQQTVLEVHAQDRPGLLYQVALALQTCQTRLLAAKVATYGARAEDYFFVSNRNGEPLTDPVKQAQLKQTIVARLGGETTPPAVMEI